VHLDFSKTCRDYIYEDSHASLDTVVAREVERQQRKNQLVMALAERGLELRSDSTLCERYINGDQAYTLQNLVNIMDEMRFYFNHTRYAEFYDDESGYASYDEFDEDSEAMDNYIEDISWIAKTKALSALKKKIGVSGILALPDLPPTIRRRLEEGEDI
jgi:hypothetical protein